MKPGVKSRIKMWLEKRRKNNFIAKVRLILETYDIENNTAMTMNKDQILKSQYTPKHCPRKRDIGYSLW